MKLKKIMALMLVGALICNTIPANAYTNSCSGYWDDESAISYSYCSDGTLVIEGTNGTESVEDACTNIAENDIKYVYVKNIGEIDVNYGGYYLFNSGGAIEYCYLDAGRLKNVFNNNDSLKELVFSNNVHTLEINVASIADGLKVTMPSTITSIDDGWLYGIDTYSTYNVTIVCEYGSEAYNWALAKQNEGRNNVHIELMDVVAKSAVKLDNTQSYQVVVPETIELTKTESGWGCETYLGVVGEIENYITIKTSKSFNIVGEDTPSTERVLVSTEDENLVDHDNLVVVKIEKDDLSNATESIELNGNSEQGYKVEYDCKLENQHVMKQVYSGCMEFIITE